MPTTYRKINPQTEEVCILRKERVDNEAYINKIISLGENHYEESYGGEERRVIQVGVAEARFRKSGHGWMAV